LPEQNIQNTNITGAELVREKHRVYLPITLRMALAFAALVLIGWAWDRTYDPTGAQQTLHLRAAGAVAIVLMAALLPRIRSPLLSALWLYAFALGILILFTVILHRLESGFSVGLGLYVYFSFGLVLLEAMSRGRAVVISDVPGSGMGWVVEDGRTGRKVPPANSAALADSLRQMAADGDTIFAMGVNGREAFHQRFHITRSADSLIPVYQSTLKGWKHRYNRK